MFVSVTDVHPCSALENAVVSGNNALIVDLIAQGEELHRPDILATREAFNLRYPVVVLLLESSGCLRNSFAVKRLEELDAHPEMIDLVRECARKLPENTDPRSIELLNALEQGDEVAAANLVVNDNAVLYSAPYSIVFKVRDFPEFLVEDLFDRGMDARLRAGIFLYLREPAQSIANDSYSSNCNKDLMRRKIVLFFEMLKVILQKPDSTERTGIIHDLWKHYTMTTYTALLTKYADRLSEECLANGIMDQDIEFDVKSFKSFSPYYQALMHNNAGVDLEQFAAEAEIEKFDARAVFELLSGTYEYDERINWDLVNRTAKASDFLEFLGHCPWYAEKADWQMINVQAEPEDWLDFLEKQPALVSKCRDIEALYCADPDRWKEIIKNSGFQNGTHFAYLWRGCDDDDWQELFKIRIDDGKVGFYDISDPGSCEDFVEFAGNDAAEFFKEMKDTIDGERLVNIIG